MGGSGMIIRGEVAEHLLRPRPVKRTFFDRIFFRRRFAAPDETDAGEFILVDIPAEELQRVKGEFTSYLRKRIPQPTDSTRVVLDYLGLKVMHVYVRGERPAEDSAASWYFQFSFSGCSGLAEESAEVAAHWAHIWYDEKGGDLRQRYLLPFGFTPFAGRPESDDFPPFVPAGEFGYASYYSEDPAPDIPVEGGASPFQLDGSVAEMGEEDRVVEFLEKHYGSLLLDGECRCQICDPESPAPRIPQPVGI